METATVTVKGQVVIPVGIREKLGIKKGTRICFLQKGEEIILRPLSKEYFENTAGFLKTQGQLSKDLLRERQRDKGRED